MVTYCHVFGCSNIGHREVDHSVFRLQTVITNQGKVCQSLSARRWQWLSNLNQDFTGKNLSNVRVCSDHFLSGTISADVSRSILLPERERQPSEAEGLPWLGQVKCVHASQVCLCCDPENVHQPPDVKWCDVTTGCDAFNNHLDHTCPDQLVDPGRTAGLSENLHDLAFDLPENGVCLNIIWPLDVVKHLQLSANLQLFGALKRLVEWHRALVRFVVPSPGGATDTPPGVQEWVDLLHGDVITPDGLRELLTSTRWHGSVRLTGSKDTKMLHLPHFCLSSYRSRTPASQIKLRIANNDTQPGSKLVQSRVASGSLEFVAAVEHSQVPSLYVTHHAFAISVPSSSRHLTKSTLFLTQLAKNRQAAYILRLWHGTCWKAAGGGGDGWGLTQPRQKDWKELVMDNIANVTDHKRAAEVDGEVAMCQFLMRFEPGDGPNSGAFVCYLLRNLNDVNGSVAMMVAKEELRSGLHPDALATNEDLTCVAKLLAGLPHYRGSGLLELLASADTVQLKALREVIEKTRGRSGKVSLSGPELLAMIKMTRNMTWDALEQSKIYSSERPSKRLRLKAVRPEYECDVMSQWEGVSLRLHEMAAGVQLLKRHSDDSLGGLAPPTGQVLTLDACEFLKHFNEDGTAVRTDGSVLRPLRSPSRRFCKYNSGDITKSEWPDCLRARDHDIYYNCEERDALEWQCERMKGRLQAVETASTCTLSQTRCPTTITINDIPTADTSVTAKMSEEPEKGQAEKDAGRSRSRERRQAGGSKRKAGPQCQPVQTDSKRKKRREETGSASGQQGMLRKGSKATASLCESRSQRHKRKLVEVVEQSIVRRGVVKGDAIFSLCINKLYTLTKCFVKDLKTSHNLRQEMERIAESHVEQVIEFEKRIKTG